MKPEDTSTIKYIAIGAGVAFLGGVLYLGLSEMTSKAKDENSQDPEQPSLKASNNNTGSKNGKPKDPKNQKRKRKRKFTYKNMKTIVDRKGMVVSVPELSVFIGFENGAPCYYLRVEMSLELSNKKELTIDLTKPGVQKVIVNGNEIKLKDLGITGSRVIIPKKNVFEGSNTIEIRAELAFDNTSQGMIQRITGTGQVVSTVHDLNGIANVLPCLDQSDIRILHKLKVSAPKSWKVVSNSRMSRNIDQIEELIVSEFYTEYIKSKNIKEEDYTVSNFLTSKTIPMRSFCLFAGDLQTSKSKKGFKMIKPEFSYLKAEEALFKKWEKDLTSLQLFVLKRTFALTKTKMVFPRLDTLILPFDGEARSYSGTIVLPSSLLSKGLDSKFDRAVLEKTFVKKTLQMWFGNYVSENRWYDVFARETLADFLANDIYKSYQQKNDPLFAKSMSAGMLKEMDRFELYAELINKNLKEDVLKFQKILDANDNIEGQHPELLSVRAINTMGLQVLEKISTEISSNKLIHILASILKSFAWNNISCDEVISQINLLTDKNFDLEYSIFEFEIGEFNIEDFKTENVNNKNSQERLSALVNLAKNILNFKERRGESLLLLAQVAANVLKAPENLLYQAVFEIISKLGVYYSHQFMEMPEFLSALVETKHPLLFSTFGNKLTLLPESLNLDVREFEHLNSSQFKDFLRTIYTLGFIDQIVEQCSDDPVKQEKLEDFLKSQAICKGFKSNTSKLVDMMLGSTLTPQDLENLENYGFKLGKEEINGLLDALYSRIVKMKENDEDMKDEMVRERFELVLALLQKTGYHVVGVWLYSKIELKREENADFFVFKLLQKHCSIYASRN